MKLNINSLAIEVTRKCNMQCEHCMRGAAQRKTIDNNHIYKLLQIVDDIGTLNITGGEPTLAMESLEQIKQCIMYGNADVGDFYMVTNGKSINVEELAEWANGMRFACHNNELSSIGFSFDTFHTQTLNWKQYEKQQRNFDRLKNVMMYEYGIEKNDGDGDFIHKHSDKSWNYSNLLSMGRAENSGCRSYEARAFESDIYNDTVNFFDRTLHLSCSGYLVAGCNWSYRNQDYNKDIQICHIDDINCTDDLIEAIKVYNMKIERVEVV